MTCTEFREIADRPLYAAASNTEYAAGFRHIDGCPGCRAYVRGAAKAQAASASASELAAADSYVESRVADILAHMLTDPEAAR